MSKSKSTKRERKLERKLERAEQALTLWIEYATQERESAQAWCERTESAEQRESSYRNTANTWRELYESAKQERNQARAALAALESAPSKSASAWLQAAQASAS